MLDCGSGGVCGGAGGVLPPPTSSTAVLIHCLMTDGIVLLHTDPAITQQLIALSACHFWGL